MPGVVLYNRHKIQAGGKSLMSVTVNVLIKQ